MLKTSIVIFMLLLACTACGEPPITDGGITFNQVAADKLTPEQYKKMDIEFFNYFDVRNEFGAYKEEQIKERTSRVIRLAEDGYEPAWLALRLYSFPTGGQTSFRDDYPIYWKKLKALADAGNASAQCFFPLVAQEYANDLKWMREAGHHFDELPTQETEANRQQYRVLAAKQGQSYCVGDSARWAYEKGEYEQGNKILRQCALEGNSDCESFMGSSYATGNRGFVEGSAKSLCWYLRAYEHNHATRELSSMDSAKLDVIQNFGDAKLAEFLAKFKPEIDCDTAKIQ